MRHFDYLRIYSDAEGCSRCEIQQIDLNTADYAPPAPALNTSTAAPAEKCIFLELPVGWYGDWHPTPVRQWLVLMSGACEFETGDGAKAIRRAGDLVLLEDTIGKGHQTKVLGDVPVRIAAVHI